MAKPRPEQISAVCKLLERLWQKYPQLRFGQVVAIIAARAGIDNDLFYVDDKKIFDQIRAELKK